MYGHLAVSALVANAIPYTLFAVAEQTVASSLAGVINGTTPLWTILIAVAARADTRLTPRRGLGVLVGFLGVLVVFEPWNATTGGAVGGVLACLGAAMSYGFGYVYQARFLTNRGLSPLTLTAAQLVVASAILALALPASGDMGARPSALALIAVIILGAIGTGVALVINFTLIGTEGPTAASVVTYLIPAVLIGVALVRRR
jgi:drug/metabolite transporter (DMT)-like permease